MALKLSKLAMKEKQAYCKHIKKTTSTFQKKKKFDSMSSHIIIHPLLYTKDFCKSCYMELT